MTTACDQATDNIGGGIAASLRGIDCLASETMQGAFARLFGSEGMLLPALTILLTLFVALFAFALITGRSRIGISALTPRMVTLGLVLTFATSWIAYQSVVWNLAVGGPDQIASIMVGGSGSATAAFADKIDLVFASIERVAGQGTGAGGGQEAQLSAFSPPGLLWMGAVLFLLGTVGVLATTRIALAVLVAIGPIFVVMALFPATRGLFVGWLKGVVMLAITPIFAVLAGGIMLEAAVPVLQALNQSPGTIDARAAMAFFMIGAVHVALMVLVLKVAGAMVSGWTVFGLAGSSEERSTITQTNTSVAVQKSAVATAGSGVASAAPGRVITMPNQTNLTAANDLVGQIPSGGQSRTIKMNTTTARTATAAGTPAKSRAAGIGSRFRAAPPRASEKIK